MSTSVASPGNIKVYLTMLKYIIPRRLERMLFVTRALRKCNSSHKEFKKTMYKPKHKSFCGVTNHSAVETIYSSFNNAQRNNL